MNPELITVETAQKTDSCEDFFTEWQAKLIDRNALWGIRRLYDDVLWRNFYLRAAREFWHPEFEPWPAVLARMSEADAKSYEDAIERCLHTQDIETTVIAVRVNGVKTATERLAVRLVRCSGCASRCGLVLVCGSPCSPSPR